jgi:phosphoribosylglycinamide formyltransferase 2
MTRILMLGSGELGKEVVIELKRLGAYVIAADRYAGAPAMQVADEFRVLDMTDVLALSQLIGEVRPDLIVPEIEAIATDALSPDVLADLKDVGSKAKVVPSYKAVSLTMNREGIRRLASEELGLKTSPYRFASSQVELEAAASEIGLPVVIKPVQSSSGKGQSVARTTEDLVNSWRISQEEARGGGTGVQRIIVEGFVDFDYEITLLTCKSISGITFCAPIGHLQVDGDYRVSWQSAPMDPSALEDAKNMAEKVVDALTPDPDDFGIFGVEMFVKSSDNCSEVIFSEVSPRPHDTGMVTLISQDISEFSMHARAILGLPVPAPALKGPSASYAVLAHGVGRPEVMRISESLSRIEQSRTASETGAIADVRVFGKPEVNGERRVAVTLALGSDIEQAKTRATHLAEALDVQVIPPTA